MGCLPLAPHSRLSQAWDLMMSLILLYVSLALPFEVAFLDTPQGSRTWWINRVVDTVCLRTYCLAASTSPSALF